MIDHSDIDSTSENFHIKKQLEWSLKFVLLGEPQVGKTSIRRRYTGKKFRDNYLPTLGADFSYLKRLRGNVSYNVTIWDLSGQPKFDIVHPQYYIGSLGAIVVYDTQDDNPIERLVKWIDRYIEYSGRNSGIILVVQNKIDLLDINDDVKKIIAHKDLLKKLEINYKDKLEILGARMSAKTGEKIQAGIDSYIDRIIDNYMRESNSRLTFGNKEIHNYYALGVYLITFDEVLGPVIVARSPPTRTMQYSDKELSSAVQVTASLNFDYLIDHNYQTGTSSWIDPPSTFYYIAFVIPNPSARSGNNLYVLGCNVNKDLKNFLNNSQDIIDGYLHKKMNEFSDFIITSGFDLSKEEDIALLYFSDTSNFSIVKLLHDLRNQMNSLIKNKLYS